jgi:agmatine deiminase
MTVRLISTPRQDGFAMPAEWATHRRCWMAWPERPDNWRDAAVPAQAAFAAVAHAIAAFEPVTVCASHAAWPRARAAHDPRVRVIELTSDDAWMRDIGPTFVRAADGDVRAVDWIFNAWGGFEGGLYAPWDADDQVAAKVAEVEGMSRYRAPFVLEGGAIHVDGEGTCLTTEECLLNPNRNPELGRAALEEGLREYLGVEKIVWLGQGLFGDETDGHVDNLCCFLRPGVVALAWSEDPDNPQTAISRDACVRLAAATDARGRRLEIVRLPVPSTALAISTAESAGVLGMAGSRPRTAGTRLPASYINFLFVNGGLILPAFDDRNDEVARAILAARCPDRRVVQVPGRELLLGGGGVHCITQQQPA